VVKIIKEQKVPGYVFFSTLLLPRPF